MKRLSYFISAWSISSDGLAAELIRTLAEQFSKVDAFGITGPAMEKTRTTSLASLGELEGYNNSEPDPKASSVIDRIHSELEKLSPQVAILVGYSNYHHTLAEYFTGRKIPVVLYGMMPGQTSLKIDAAAFAQRIQLVLGIFPKAGSLCVEAKVPFRFVGCPMRDRVDQVKITRRRLALPEDRPIVSFYPGSRLEAFEGLFDIIMTTAEKLQRMQSDLVLILPIPSLVYEHAKEKLCDATKRKALPAAKGPSGFSYGPLWVVESMTLEMLALSDLAVTGCGAVTIECGLLGTPFLPIYLSAHVKAGKPPYALLNQIWDSPLVEEFASDTSAELLAKKALSLLNDGEQRSAVLQSFEQVSAALHGFAAENAAEIIGNEIAKWHVKSPSKDFKFA